ncbi:hypothetical protein HAV1_gp22 [Hyperthermophilic Archaeal Virus 1]|uniref:hypothetical protein n=1 Tax=Hyperthermophilic Archaeal Virus 1 TaxID=762905 RepID=UPI0001DBAE01|nr:hypothetical protein HAV1_gp22 [Hyperthermophilic Archaeal Virus 1]ADJ54245.1 hypothetical protein HAV1_gp22 [Hyperthermophilic Archaeal Virus 1]
MPRKSAINRGGAKFQKLYMRILNTVKAQFPNAPDEVVAQHAAEGVYKYASALGYYEGMWRGFKAYLEGKGVTDAYRHIMGPLRSAVVHLARLQLTGATDTELENAINGLGLPDPVKNALREFFIIGKVKQ